MAGKTLGRLIPQVEHEIIAVRAHQRDAALDLALPGSGQLGQHDGLQHLAVRGINGGFILHVRRPRLRREAGIGGGNVVQEGIDKRKARRNDLCA